MKNHSLLTFILLPQYGQLTKSMGCSSIKSDTRTSNALAIACNVLRVGLPAIERDTTACVTPNLSASSFCDTPFSFNIILILFFIPQRYINYTYIHNVIIKCNINSKDLNIININNLVDCDIYATFAQ